MSRKRVFDPIAHQIRSQSETSSGRIRNKLNNPYDWCFCELCYQTTEYSIALGNLKIYRKLPKNNAIAVVMTEAMQREAKRMAATLVARYERALKGQYGPYEVAKLQHTYCDWVGERVDYSVEFFRDHVEQYANTYILAKHGDILGTPQLPRQREGEAKPSRLYCSNHNPRRSDEARRTYQRDRRFVAEYQDIIAIIWRNYAGRLPSWDISLHVQVRRAAYDFVQLSKKTIHFIDMYKTQGVSNGEEIGSALGMTRQAISAARKRHVDDDIRERQLQANNLEVLCKKIFGTSF